MNDDSASPPAAGSRRIAAIDVGTNSIRLTVAEAFSDGRYRILDDEKETTRLGRGLHATGKMTAEAMEQSVRAIARMRRIAEGYGVEVLRAIGTCALREASNRNEFLDLVQSRADVRVEPICPEAEAQLAHLSVAHAFDLHALPAAVVDIGGGSTELVLSAGGLIEQVYSLPLGAVRLTEQFGGPEPSAGDLYDKMRREVRRVLKRTVKKLPFVPQLIIGTGGTFTSLANISLHLNHAASANGFSRSTVRGYELRRAEVRHVVDWLREMPLRDRARVPGLNADRADIIVAGLTIVERVMKLLGVNRLQVHDGGIRDGLIRTMARSLFPEASRPSPAPPDHLRSVRQFAANCSHEERHCNHVVHLAGQIFDQLAEAFPEPGGWSEPGNRLLLEAAALLHDVGYLINYSQHHKHSYHLIAHSDLVGLTPREIALVANVARYHCGAEPRRKHPNFGQLPRADRKRVRRLAAILRVADGLDRNHVQNVRGVSLRVEGDTVHFLLEAATDPAVDIWGAVRKSPLFQKVFAIKPRFEWKLAGDAAAECEPGGECSTNSLAL